MLGLFFTTLQTDPHLFVYVVVTVVFSVTFHELAHGYAALRLGDMTPKRAGHWTINPLVHMGGASLLMLMIFGVAFGAMPVDPRNLRGRYGGVLVALAGPLSNVLLFFVAATSLAALQVSAGGAAQTIWQENVRDFLAVFSVVNLTLAMFNMLPVPPLDGARVFGGLIPRYGRMLQQARDPRVFLVAFLLVLVAVNQLDGGITGPAHEGLRRYVPWVIALFGG